MPKTSDEHNCYGRIPVVLFFLNPGIRHERGYEGHERGYEGHDCDYDKQKYI